MEWTSLKRVAAWQVLDDAGNCATVLHLLDADMYLWLVVDPENNTIAEGSAQTLDEAEDAAEGVIASL